MCLFSLWYKYFRRQLSHFKVDSSYQSSCSCAWPVPYNSGRLLCSKSDRTAEWPRNRPPFLEQNSVLESGNWNGETRNYKYPCKERKWRKMIRRKQQEAARCDFAMESGGKKATVNEQCNTLETDWEMGWVDRPSREEKIDETAGLCESEVDQVRQRVDEIWYDTANKKELRRNEREGGWKQATELGTARKAKEIESRRMNHGGQRYCFCTR